MTSDGGTETDYQRGVRDGRNQVRDDLAASLRLHTISTGQDGEEVLTLAQAREIFSDVLGVKAADDEFGQDSRCGI